jgi:mycothiol system anti-sigma-R factor
VSCGKPHETDCSQVIAEVWLLLDHECSAERRRKLVQHLDECGPCLEQYGIEEHLKELLARKCGGEHAPDALKEKLRASIRQVVVAQADGLVAVEIQQTSVRVIEDED